MRADEGSNYLFKESKSPKSNCLKCPQFFYWPEFCSSCFAFFTPPAPFARCTTQTHRPSFANPNASGQIPVKDVLVIDINSVRVSSTGMTWHCDEQVLQMAGWLVILIRMDSHPETTSTRRLKNNWNGSGLEHCSMCGQPWRLLKLIGPSDCVQHLLPLPRTEIEDWSGWGGWMGRIFNYWLNQPVNVTHEIAARTRNVTIHPCCPKINGREGVNRWWLVSSDMDYSTLTLTIMISGKDGRKQTTSWVAKYSNLSFPLWGLNTPLCDSHHTDVRTIIRWNFSENLLNFLVKII